MMQTSFTVKSAAEHIGVSRVWVRDAIRDGCSELGDRKLRANKRGEPWTVNPDDVETIRRVRRAGKMPRAPDHWNTTFEMLAEKLAVRRTTVHKMCNRSSIWLGGEQLNWGWGMRRAGPNIQPMKLVDPVHIAMLIKARNNPAPEAKIAAKSKGEPLPKYKHVNRGLFNWCKKNSEFLGASLVAIREPSLVDGIGHFLEFYDEWLIKKLNELAVAGAAVRHVDKHGEEWLTRSRARKDGFGNPAHLWWLEQKGQLKPEKFWTLSESGTLRQLGVRHLKTLFQNLERMVSIPPS
jgi:hypothetical protein